MREEIQVLLEEIEELEMALSESDNNTVSVVLQEAIDKRRKNWRTKAKWICHGRCSP
ncbi:hypothetical protein ACO7RW_01470 [Bacillus amyloliquefaciens]|uniref:hypothetical protein n=1 Tax=Bacillus amyloliquefaciens group TaxID=1938374 RepID=UPI002944258E|nr:hypothetical protein [Bacillus velezensis]MDV5126978.1 hypothetical protein [Bacillus velezensis]